MATKTASKRRSQNVLRFINSCGNDTDISSLLGANLLAGARLAAKNRSEALHESTARTYELKLLALEDFALKNEDDALLFGENKRPFMAATIQTYLRKYNTRINLKIIFLTIAVHSVRCVLQLKFGLRSLLGIYTPGLQWLWSFNN